MGNIRRLGRITWSKDVLAICGKWGASAPTEAMVPEPYLPHVPENWNGILVLAESQQLAGAHEYREWLEGLPSDQRMVRLSLGNPSGVGVGPWDDGTVKLALKAMLPEIEVERTAVGNAVPWSRCTSKGTNANPSEVMKQSAITFWRDLLPVWRPVFRTVVLLGKVARTIASRAGIRNSIALRLPSPNNINRICGMFDIDDLMTRYPEVREAGKEVATELNLRNVFFACHAVSLGRRRERELQAAPAEHSRQGIAGEEHG